MTIPHLTAQEARHRLLEFSTLFDTVRLVDVQKGRILFITEGGELKESTTFCFNPWKKGRRCLNCISSKAYAIKGRATKLEFLDDAVFTVISQYVVVDEKPCVLEFVYKVEDSVLLDAIGKSHLVRLLAENNREISTDFLTQVHNRRYLDEQISMLTADGVVMLDVDNFKQVNDRYGHGVGDMVLRFVASALKSVARSGDFVARYGGDEFTVVFEYIDRDGFQSCLEKIVSSVRAIKIPDHPDLRLSVSIGAHWGKSFVQDALPIADKLLYQAKQKKDCWVID